MNGDRGKIGIFEDNLFSHRAEFMPHFKISIY